MLSVPIIVEIGTGETALGHTKGIVESLYVSSHNKSNRRYAKRAFDALTAAPGADLESIARSAFGCDQAGVAANPCKNVVVWPLAKSEMAADDVGKILEQNGWPMALWLKIWVESSPDGVAIRGFVQPYTQLQSNSRQPIPMGYIEAAPEDVMNAARGAGKPDEWLMEHYWLSNGPSPLPAVFSRGLSEMKGMLAYAVPTGNFENPIQLRHALKRHDQLRYFKDQGIGCKNMAHCNSQVVRQLPSRLWVWRAAVGYAYLFELVSEPIMRINM
jgi:hypothetical protein